MHPNEKVLRDAYAAFAKGDVPGFLAYCTPNPTFHMPGTGLLAGHHTKDEFFAKLGPAMKAVSDSLVEEVLRVVASDENGAVLVHQKASRDGKTYEWDCAHWWRIEGGKLADFREYVDDTTAYEAAWRR